MKQFVLILIAALAVSCTGGDSESPVVTTSPTTPGSQTPAPAPPASPTFNGNYSGTATGTGHFRIEPTVSGELITGLLRTPPEAETQGTIPLSGTVSAAGAVTMTAIDDCGAAAYRLTGSITVDSAGAARMDGTWTEGGAAGCRSATSGTFTAARQ
jgi:hypothetical protein